MRPCAGVCPESVTVSGAEAVQPTRMGTYTKVPNLTQGERPVYKLSGSIVLYLYYWPSMAEWRIGVDYTSHNTGVKSTGGGAPACPDRATGWQAATANTWVSTYPIRVVPTDAGNAPAFVRMWSGPPTATLALRCGFRRLHGMQHEVPARADYGRRPAYY